MDNFYSTIQRWETGLDRWLFCTWENVMQNIFQKIQDFFRRMKLGNKACCLKCILKQRRATDKKFLLENLQSALKSATVSWSHASTRRTLETEEKELGTAFQVMPPRISSCPEMILSQINFQHHQLQRHLHPEPRLPKHLLRHHLAQLHHQQVRHRFVYGKTT